MMVFWGIIAFILITLELLLPGMFFALSFACGCAVASFFSLCAPVEIQVSSAIIGSLIGYVLLRGYTQRFQKIPPLPTNVDRLKGRRLIVMSDVSENGFGTGKVDGTVWNIIDKDNQRIHKGTPVKIIAIHGCHLIVEKIKD